MGALRKRFLLDTLLMVLCLLAVAVPSSAESRVTAMARHAMVVSADSLATAAGIAVLRHGGNAVDAAVAVGFTLAVTYPEAGNIGGGGFMLIRFSDGGATMIDFREKAPAAATRDMYLDSLGRPIPDKSTFGPVAAGVPGTVAGLLLALESYGSLSRQDDMNPAISLAAGGFRVDSRLAASVKSSLAGLSSFPSSLAAFTRKGIPPDEGDTLKQPDLTRTLEAIRDEGTEGFYTGRIADLIVDEMKRHGGLITRDDLKGYRAIERDPLSGSYRGCDILTASPPSGGGTTLLEILNILERFDLGTLGPGDSRFVHLFAAASQRAFADRAEYLGDPDRVDIPVDELVSKEYARIRSESLDSLRATPSSEIHAGAPEGVEETETTHFAVVDSQGNVVSVTYTLNDAYGCKDVVEGAGFLLNDEMDDFVVKPGYPNMYGLVGGSADAIAPGKRMLSSMSPTIVMKGDHLLLDLGARGGSRIPTSVAQVIINMVDFGMDLERAVATPRVHHQWLPDELLYEQWGLSSDARESLSRMGHRLKLSDSPIGEVQAIAFDPGRGILIGVPDPREGGCAAGY